MTFLKRLGSTTFYRSLAEFILSEVEGLGMGYGRTIDETAVRIDGTAAHPEVTRGLVKTISSDRSLAYARDGIRSDD